MERLLNIVRKTGWTIAIVSILVLLYAGIEVTQLPALPDRLDRLDLSEPTVIYDAQNIPITEIGARRIVPFNLIAPYFIDAIVTAEDHRFYEHRGIDKIGIFRAIIGNILTMGNYGGGSTITQQLAKNLFFSFERSYTRKVKDILLALQFEHRYTKKEILTAYCNQVAFGNGAYGVENAAMSYFGKHASDINLTESIILASIPQRPSYFNPYIDSERVKSRYMTILGKLRTTRKISNEEYEEAAHYRFSLTNLVSRKNQAPHFIELVKQYVVENYDEEMLNFGGLKIYTTLNLNHQKAAQKSIRDGMQSLDSRLGLSDYRVSPKELKGDYPEGALAAIDVNSGAIIALIGGRDEKGDYYNRAVSAKRSPGSSFKPLVYLTAIERNNIDGSVVYVDSQVTYSVPGGSWTPRNFERDFQGSVTLKYALKRSINTIAAQLIDKVTPQAVIATARSFGIETELEAVPSLALGSNGISLIEMTEVYATFASGGLHSEPYFIARIEGSNGDLLEEHSPSFGERIAREEDVYLMQDMLSGVLDDEGTGASIRRRGFNYPAGGKTGTTNDFRDAWFAGITPEIVAVTWVGFDDYRSMQDPNAIGITGSSGALPIWSEFINGIKESLRPRDFTIPPGIEFKIVDKKTGLEVSGIDENALKIAVKIK